MQRHNQKNITKNLRLRNGGFALFHLCVPLLDSTLYLTGAQATRAGVKVARSTINDSFNTLNVWLPGSVGSSVGVGNPNAKGNALSANIALSH